MTCDSHKLDSNERILAYVRRRTSVTRCAWMALVVIFIGVNCILVYFNQHRHVFNYYTEKYASSHVDSTFDQFNTTCADAILNWCHEHFIDSSNCSWKVGTFRNHFYAMAALINPPFPDSTNNHRGLALIRLGDGEMKLIFGIAVRSIDPWLWPGGQSTLGQDLRKALNYPKYKYNSYSPVYYGIYNAKDICPFHELLSMIYQHPKYLTYTNLFVNSNYPATKLLHQSLIRDYKKKIILIINNATSPTKLAELEEWAGEIVQYPHDGPLLWEKKTFREQAIGKIATIAKKYRNRLFFFSVGPLSRILIHYAWLENPFNRYIDFGSTLDQMTKSKVTRPYQSNAELNRDPTYEIKYNKNKQLFEVSSID